MHLITGGSGLLGQALTGALLERNHTVRVLDRKPPVPDLAGRVECPRP